LAKVVASSTSSGEVRVPELNDPPCTQTIAGRLVSGSLTGGA
jgi:hypothetical protein